MAINTKSLDEIIQLIKQSTTSKQIYNEQLQEMLDLLRDLKGQQMTPEEIESIISLIETMLVSFYNKEEIDYKFEQIEQKISETEIVKPDEYTHTQLAQEDLWTITHNFNFKRPRVIVYDNNNEELIGEIDYIDENKLTISFDSNINGKAYVML